MTILDEINERLDLIELKLNEINEKLNPKPEKFLTRKQVAEILQVDLSTLWRWNKEGILNVIEIGGKRKYKLSEVNKLRRIEQ